MEDASPEFSRVRDFVDVRNALALPFFADVVANKKPIASLDMKETTTHLRKELKLNKTQCRKVYEIIKLKYTNTTDPDTYKNYRLEIKKRINSISHDRLSKIQQPQEVRLSELEKMYKLTEDEYRTILNNVAMYGSA